MAKPPLEVRVRARRFRVGDFAKRLEELPKSLRRSALIVMAEYLLKKFKLYPRYKYVSRKNAYPEVGGFFSDRQRKFVMAGISSGRIRPGSPHRTLGLKGDWKIEGREARDIRSISLVNANPVAVYAYHPVFQARQLELVGWKNTDVMVDENLNDGILEVEVWLYNNYPDIFNEIMR